MKQLWPKILICTAFCMGLGLLSSWQKVEVLQGWYKSIVKPLWIPADKTIIWVWIVLYLMMGLSLALIWHTQNKNKRWAIHLFIAQFLLNYIWSYLFFTLHSPGLALIAVSILVISIALTILYFMPINKIAGTLLIPYFIWILLATLMNNKIFLLN